MAYPRMYGPYNLTADNIHRYVRANAAGVFAVGYTRESGAFVVCYIGRSDTNLRDALLAYPHDEMARFKWVETTSQRSAFQTQCELYHEFGGADSLENEEHPPRPQGSNWTCPVCSIYRR